MNLTAIRDEIAYKLSQRAAVTATARVPAVSEITVPHAFISEMSMRFASMGDSVDIDFEVTVLISLADADSGWDQLSELWDVDSGKSVVDALLNDRKLNGTVHGLTFNELRNVSSGYDVGSVLYLGFQMMFTVHA